MNILNTDRLTVNQLKEAENLIELCCHEDGTKVICFFQSDMNVIYDLPAFFLMYHKNILVSFLSIFVPDYKECEIYAYTLPEYRRQGCFCRLYKKADRLIRNYGIRKIYFVNEPYGITGDKVLKRIGAKLESSEYLMAYNMDIEPRPQGILILLHSKTENGELLETYKKDIKIGSINLELEQNTAIIYNVEIEEKYRGRGYGTETLLLVLEYLKNSKYEKIILHVSSLNKIAYGMYSRHGFVNIQQVDYWFKKI